MSTTAQRTHWWNPFTAGLRGVSWQTLALILAINTGFAALLFIDDTRPFWHPFITAQCFGLSIAYAVNAGSPWEKSHPIWRLVFAVAIGAVAGCALMILVKGYSLADMRAEPHRFAMTLLGGFTTGLFVSLFFLVKFREARTRTEIVRSEADRNLLSKQAIEAELKLMQAQIEPHFLFNTLASVQYLTETDPPKAGLMLGHLLAYLRAALPQLRSGSSTLGQEVDLASAYLSIMQMRMGSRLSFAIDIPAVLRPHPFPPMLLMSVVENAIKHGIEPQAESGEVRIEARLADGALCVEVTDTGRGLAGSPGKGIGLSNLRERLKALYGHRSRFALEGLAPRGARASIEIPYAAASR
jgi:signal transduction histidine kinase